MAIKVTLRRKPISGGRLSLFLDFYPAIAHPITGVPTRREFLNKHVWESPADAVQVEHNRATELLAEMRKQRVEYETSRPEIYGAAENERLAQVKRSQENFVTYFEQLGRERKGSSAKSWEIVLKYLKEFAGSHIAFADVDVQWCERFKKYLRNTTSARSSASRLSQNTAAAYFMKVKAALKQAYREGYLCTDVNARVAHLPMSETRRNFLSLEELNSLCQTECANPLMKRAAIFSALTGLRFSDIQKLLWAEVQQDVGRGAFLQFRQRKTQSEEVLPISEQAFQLLGERREPADKVFEGLTYSAYHNRHLHQWIGAAGITKPITFHCFRHTFATLQLSSGTDLFTVGKMLGHKDVKTTQIYAKVVDASKRAAADRIKLAL